MRIVDLLKTRKKDVAVLSVLVFLATSFDVVVPFITQRLIDTLIQFFKSGGQAPINLLIFASVGILAATIFARFLKSTYDYRLFKTVTALEDNLRHSVFEKYLRLHVLFHHGSSSGQIIGRIERGATAVYVILHDIFGQNLVPPAMVL